VNDERHTGGLGDAPIEDEFHAVMNKIARALDDLLNEPEDLARGERRIGFILMVFPFDEHQGRCNYISTAAREDVVVLLREQLRRFEGQAEPPTGHA
jgi:hypothetical protein